MKRTLKYKEQKMYKLSMNDICLTRNCHISFPKQTKLDHQHCFKNFKDHKLNTVILNCNCKLPGVFTPILYTPGMTLDLSNLPMH
jgi:hypothetical protein